MAENDTAVIKEAADVLLSLGAKEKQALIEEVAMLRSKIGLIEGARRAAVEERDQLQKELEAAERRVKNAIPSDIAAVKDKLAEVIRINRQLCDGQMKEVIQGAVKKQIEDTEAELAQVRADRDAIRPQYEQAVHDRNVLKTRVEELIAEAAERDKQILRLQKGNRGKRQKAVDRAASLDSFADVADLASNFCAGLAEEIRKMKRG